MIPSHFWAELGSGEQRTLQTMAHDNSSQQMKRTIAESIQMQAKKLSSPVVSDFLIAARRGFMEQVLQALKEGGSAKASTTDKVAS